MHCVLSTFENGNACEFEAVASVYYEFALRRTARSSSTSNIQMSFAKIGYMCCLATCE